MTTTPNAALQTAFRAGIEWACREQRTDEPIREAIDVAAIEYAGNPDTPIASRADDSSPLAADVAWSRLEAAAGWIGTARSRGRRTAHSPSSSSSGGARPPAAVRSTYHYDAGR